MNSFALLQEEEDKFFVKEYEKKVRHAVESRLRTVHFISDILEHFFPVHADTLTVLAGGEVLDPENTYFTIEEEDESDRLSPGPGATEGDDLIR